MPARISLASHLAILAAVPFAAAGLSLALRRRPAWKRATRYTLASMLALNELIWYGYRLHTEGFRFPDELPLQLCDLCLWLTVISAFALPPRVYEVAYYGGIGGGTMALLMPDLWSNFPSYPSIYFFISHGLMVATLVTLAGGGILWPRRGSLWRAFAILNLYLLAMAAFDAAFKTDYLYLCSKPVTASLLNYFGPWPEYILVEDAFALLVFWLLWLAVRKAPAVD